MSRPPHAHAIFDFDGTLADTFECFARSVNECAERFGFRRVELHEVDELRGLSAREIMARLEVSPWRVPAMARYMHRRMAEDPTIALFEGASQLLRTCQSHGVATSIVTSNARDNVLRILGPDHAARIAHLECGTSLFGKARKLRRLLRRARLPGNRTVYVGDELRDAEAASRAGVHFIGVAWGYTHPRALATRSQAVVVHSMAELAEALLGAAGSRA